MFDFLQQIAAALRIPASFVIIEFIGTMAFAVSGIRLASSKRFDWFGALIVGMATAVGGGTIRDLMLGVSPFWLTNKIYIICCIVSLLWVVIFGKVLIHQKNTWFIFDTVGLALFNVIGIEKTLQMGFPLWTAITMGCITGAAGGVIRDILINEVPLIFRKEIYAMACIAGGVVYVTCYKAFGMSAELNALFSSMVVIAVRVLAVKYQWHLPVLKGDESKDEEG
ncbi:MAG: trimeric intracellular cation channel family protein [Bacteroidales bacterium]|nr:trimeric intracellular cation channel family protein [Bacteroidales bacterium]